MTTAPSSSFDPLAERRGGGVGAASLKPLPAFRTARPGDKVVEALLLMAAVAGVFITTGIVYILLTESWPFFEKVSLGEFLTSTRWTPQFDDAHYGILPLVAGTVTTTIIALSVALPVGLVLSLWLSEFAPPKFREFIKPVLELLAAVPTVVYGYFAVQFVSPLLQQGFRAVGSDLSTFNMLSAGLVMGVMIIPYISSLSEDAMRSVPMILREGSYGMGANRVQTGVKVVLPAALSGIAAASILAVSRAVGETMIVAIAAGQQPTFTFNPKEQAATITAYIVQVTMGDQPHGTTGYQSIFAAGLALFTMTLGFNLVGIYLRRRFREAY